MNYTQNYHLPQWALNDRIMMDDFNQMCASLENGLTSNKAAQEQGDAALANQVAEAKQTASSASAKADSALAQKPYVTGSYVGSGSSRTIALGFRPSFVIVSGAVESTAAGNYSLCYYTVMTAGSVLKNRLTLTDTGFTVNHNLSYSPLLTENSHTYDYIAFK